MIQRNRLKINLVTNDSDKRKLVFTVLTSILLL
jgi:hypothetical protein